MFLRKTTTVGVRNRFELNFSGVVEKVMTVSFLLVINVEGGLVNPHAFSIIHINATVQHKMTWFSPKRSDNSSD